jgi:integrase/recombinase XerD
LRLAGLGTNARDDKELMAIWLKTHADGSAHTITLYTRLGERFLAALVIAGVSMRTATLEDVLTAIDALRTKPDGTPVKPGSLNTYTAAVKSLLGLASKIGYTRFSAGPLIKLKKAGRIVAQRILSEVAVHRLLDAAKPGRDHLLLQVAYFGGLRVTELTTLQWRQVIERDSGEAQLELIGKGGKVRQVLLPAPIARRLLASRGDAPAEAPVFASTRRPGQPLTQRATNYIIKRAAKRAGVNPATSAHWMRHAHASHALDRGAPIQLVSSTLGHSDLKTTSVYAHARPGESSGRYLQIE